MSTHHLAITVAILFAANWAFVLGNPRAKSEKLEWTAQHTFVVLLRTPYTVFIVWLLLRVA